MEKEMNILYVRHPSERLGSESTHVEEVIANLRKLGHTVTPTRAGYSGLSVARRVGRLGSLSWLRGELLLLWLLWVELKLLVWTISSGRHADVIYSRHRWLNGAELLYSKLKRVPYIREVNGFVADEMVVRKAGSGFSVWLFDRIEKWNLRRGDRWIAVTTRMKVTLAEEYGVPKKKVAVVENGANTELFRPLEERERRVHIGVPAICFIGTLWGVQGIEHLIRAMLHISARLLLIGGGSEEKELRKLTAELGVDSKVLFVKRAPQEEMPHWIAASDVCIGPLTLNNRNRRTGVSPLKVYEYMACGKPIVAARTPGLEFIETEGLGVLVEPDSPEQVADAVNTLLRYPELRLEMGRKARKYVVENRSWERVAEQIAEVMGEATKE